MHNTSPLLIEAIHHSILVIHYVSFLHRICPNIPHPSHTLYLMSSYVCGCPASSYLNNREDWGVPAIDPTDLPPASCKDHGGPLDKISKETILRALDQPAEDPHMTWSTTNPHGSTARGYRANSQKKAEIEQNLEKNSLERMQVDTTNDDHARVLLAKDRFEQAHSRVAVAWTQKQEQERQSKAKLEGA